MFGQQRNILAAFLERWHMDGHNVQAVKQFLAKGPRINSDGQVFGCAGNNAQVHLDFIHRPDPLKLLVHQHAQDF